MKTKMYIGSILIFCLCMAPIVAHDSFKIPSYSSLAKKNFKWLKKDFYNYLEYKCYKKNIDPIFILSLAQVESGGRNIRSHRMNRNKTFDWGFFQINSVHSPKNPRRLLNYRVNIDIATWYLGKCLKKARGNKFLACIYYNGGTNCNVRRYMKKNSAYPKRIMKIYARCKKNIDASYRRALRRGIK